MLFYKKYSLTKEFSSRFSVLKSASTKFSFLTKDEQMIFMNGRILCDRDEFVCTPQKSLTIFLSVGVVTARPASRKVYDVRVVALR